MVDASVPAPAAGGARALATACALALAIGPLLARAPASGAEKEPGSGTVRGYVQTRPGGPRWETEVEVRPSPTDPRTVPADSIRMPGDELVLGVAVGGAAVAYPIRFLAMFEVVDDRVGGTPLAPTW